MDWASQHLNYVVAAYAVSVITLVTIAIVIFAKRKALARDLSSLDQET